MLALEVAAKDVMRKIEVSEDARHQHLRAYARVVRRVLRRLSRGQKIDWEVRTSKTHPDTIKKHRALLKVLVRPKVLSFFQFLRAKNRGDALLVGSPAVLFEVADQIEKRLLSLADDERRSIRRVLEKLFNYDGFRDGKKLRCDSPDWRVSWVVAKKKRVWGGWEYARSLGVRYCPYCNAESVGYGAETDEHGNVLRLFKSAYDHVLPQGRYPYLAIALENLVPSCTRCNSVLKHEHDLLAEFRKTHCIPMLHPYVDNIVDHLEFFFNPTRISDFYDEKPGEIHLEVRVKQDSEEERTKRFNTEFALKDIYGWIYSREVLEFARVSAIYSPALRQLLEKKYPGLVQSEIDAVIYRADLTPGNENKSRFSKAIRDLTEQFDSSPLSALEKKRIMQNFLA